MTKNIDPEKIVREIKRKTCAYHLIHPEQSTPGEGVSFGG
jgi:hypothetical protein